jgi:WASH complex subunit strumpellin
MSKIFAFCGEILFRVGQMQLLRTKICYQLHNLAKFDSKQLLHALRTFNEALMSDINAHFEDPSNPYPDEENPLLYELDPYLECVGLTEPLKKIYVTASKCDYIAFFASMLVLSQLPKLASIKLNGKLSLLNYPLWLFEFLFSIFVVSSARVQRQLDRDRSKQR